MQMTREAWLLVASASLLAVTLLALFRGCRCAAGMEGFATAASAAREPVASPAMTQEELKLFDELKSDKYTPDQIDHMVSSGVIDQKLVEKFLDKLETVDVPAGSEK